MMMPRERRRPETFSSASESGLGCGSTPGSGSSHCTQSSLGFHVGGISVGRRLRAGRQRRSPQSTAVAPRRCHCTQTPKRTSHARATCARHSCSQTFFHRLGPGSPFVYHRRPFVLTRPPTFDDFTIDEFPCFSRPTRHGAARRQPADQGRRAAAAAAPVSARLRLALRHRLARLPALLPDPRPLREAHRRARMDLRLGRHHRHLPDPRLALHPLER